MKTIIKFQSIVFFLLILFSCKNERENRQVKLESLEICNVKIDLLNIFIVNFSYFMYNLYNISFYGGFHYVTTAGKF